MWPDHMWGGWGMWFIGGLVMLLFWGGLFALAFVAIRAVLRSGKNDTGGRSSASHADSSLEILKQRYARGEISREEYLSMRKDLEE